MTIDTPFSQLRKRINHVINQSNKPPNFDLQSLPSSFQDSPIIPSKIHLSYLIVDSTTNSTNDSPTVLTPSSATHSIPNLNAALHRTDSTTAIFHRPKDDREKKGGDGKRLRDESRENRVEQ